MIDGKMQREKRMKKDLFCTVIESTRLTACSIPLFVEASGPLLQWFAFTFHSIEEWFS